jgi:L-alanine-DL-glutamate epimerase-like enolase superfamily enzyme
MKITSVSTAVVEANFDWTIVRIEAENGAVGWGESFFAPGLTSIIRAMGALMVGTDARDIQAQVARLTAAASGAGSVGGIVHNAISGIDAALWDLNARALGIPLWQLLGGRFSSSVRVYADCHGGAGLMSLGPLLELRSPRWAKDAHVARGLEGKMLFDPGAETEPVDPALLSRRAREAVDAGFTALKFDLDVPGLIPEEPGSRTAPRGAEAVVRTIADAVAAGAGADIDIAYDLHWRYDLPSAARIAAAVADRSILWLEDPLPPHNVDGLLALAARTTVPLGGGENLIGARSFDRLISAGALSVVTPDLGKVGGVGEARRIAESAHERGLSIAPHNIAGPVGTAFAAQLCATWPNVVALEYHAQDVPFFDALIGDAPLIVAGRIPMTDEPGIGVTVDVDAVREWAKPGEAIFEEPLR